MASESCLLRCPGFELPFSSEEFGVGQRGALTISSSPALPCAFLPRCGPFPVLAVGVGQLLHSAVTAQPSLFGVLRPSPEHVSVKSSDAFAALGVGQRDEKDALAEVWGSHVGRRKHTPLRSEPHFGQVSENVAELH